MFGSFVDSKTCWMICLMTTFVAIEGSLFVFGLLVNFNMLFPIGAKVTLVTVVSYAFMFCCSVPLKAFFCSCCEFTQVTAIFNALVFHLLVIGKSELTHG